MNQYFKVLGTIQRDRVTGFEGMVSSLCFDAYGCVQALIQPRVAKDGSIPEPKWFDTNRLENRKKRVMALPAFVAPTAVEHEHGPAAKPSLPSMPVPGAR